MKKLRRHSWNSLWLLSCLRLAGLALAGQGAGTWGHTWLPRYVWELTCRHFGAEGSQEQLPEGSQDLSEVNSWAQAAPGLRGSVGTPSPRGVSSQEELGMHPILSELSLPCQALTHHIPQKMERKKLPVPNNWILSAKRLGRQVPVFVYFHPL